MYTLPTVRQILFHWDLKPIAKVVALVIRETAEEKIGEPLTDKKYNHMSQQDRDEYDRERKQDAKVWESARQLSKTARADREAINAALDELQKGKFLDSDRPLGKPKHRGNKKYYFRLHSI